MTRRPSPGSRVGQVVAEGGGEIAALRQGLQVLLVRLDLCQGEDLTKASARTVDLPIPPKRDPGASNAAGPRAKALASAK